MNQAVDQVLGLAMELHDYCVGTFSPKIKFDLKRDWLVLCLYGSLVEYSGAYLALVERKRHTGTSSVFRSFLEAYVDLINAIADPDYQEWLRWSYHKEWLRLLKASNKNNPYLAKIAHAAKEANGVEHHEEELKALGDVNIKSMTTRERFRRADMENEYDSIYNFVCSDTHNNMRALTSRHIHKEGDNFGITFYKGVKNFMYPEIDAVCAFLWQACIKLNERFQMKCDEELSTFWQRLEECRKTAGA